MMVPESAIAVDLTPFTDVVLARIAGGLVVGEGGRWIDLATAVDQERMHYRHLCDGDVRFDGMWVTLDEALSRAAAQTPDGATHSNSAVSVDRMVEPCEELPVISDGGSHDHQTLDDFPCFEELTGQTVMLTRESLLKALSREEADGPDAVPPIPVSSSTTSLPNAPTPDTVVIQIDMEDSVDLDSLPSSP